MAYRTRFRCVNPISVFITVALQAKRYAVSDVIAQFWMIRIRTNVVNLKYNPTFAAFLAGVVVSPNHRITPLPILCPLSIDVSLSRFRFIFSLIVREFVAFFHCLRKHASTIFSAEYLFACIGYFHSSFWASISALSGTIHRSCSVCLECFSAILTCFNHRNLQNKIPCLRSWLLLSRQLAPIRKQGILTNYIPTESVIQSA